ncbi:Coiled-coil domain-containing protein 116 [Apodemus speciosus]|uniref:Coiled-coil domain-containing protein 116 n=1 Tax=Apodemus speciosus TaxID=105296 RepID=A0ABQ0FLC3_APOSI
MMRLLTAPMWLGLPKKYLLPEMKTTCKLGHVPHLPSMNRGSERQGHQQGLRRPPAFGGFLDFLTEGRVLDSLQTVVEQATECVATMKTEAGVPLVDIQDPVEVPSSRHRARGRPSIGTVHRHRARPTLCAGRPNNYPSCSSSMSDSHSSVTAGWLGSRSQDSDLGARGIGSLPPMRDKLLLEKNLKRLLRLENKGKVLNQPCSQRDSLLWDSLGSQASSQWTREQPLSWFSGLLGSSSVTPETSELGLGEQEMIFLRQELNREMKSLLNQPTSFNLPAYCPLREPHRTLDFLAEHRLFPALQSVVSQAVDKLSHACRHNGFPLFPVTSETTPVLPGNSDLLQPSSKASIPTDREARGEPCDSPTPASSPKSSRKKSRGRRDSPSNAVQMATRFRLKDRDSLCSPGCPGTHRLCRIAWLGTQKSACLCLLSAGIKGVRHSHSHCSCWHCCHHHPAGSEFLPRGQLYYGLTLKVSGHLNPPSSGADVIPSEHAALPACTSKPAQSPNKFSKRKPLPSISSVSSLSYVSNPWFEELTNFLVEQAVSLLVCKHKFEESLNKQLGFISFPITEVLMDIFLGFKKVKGTHIRLSSDINWTCLLRKLEEAELARQALRHASRSGASPRSASRVGTSQHSTEPSSMQPELTGDTAQGRSPESHLSLRPELPIRQLLSPRDPGTGQEQPPDMTLSESRPSMTPSARMGSKSKEVNMEEGEDSEEEEEEEEDEEEEEEEEEEDRGSEDETKALSDGEHTPPSPPSHELEDFMNTATVMSPSNSP